MSKIQVNQDVLSIKKQLQKIAQDLIEASDQFGLDAENRSILERQIEHINDNFLFVVAGEVNAGKSSFINALLGADVSPTSHEICTDKISKIVYGQSEQIIDDEQTDVVIREYPDDILKQITIVDTPGTNSKAVDHQIITQRFIPHANLIIFVFMTENIHAESAWQLFREIKDKWGKNVVFVQTKKDMYTDEQVAGYRNTLKRYVEAEGIQNPKIFSTSAKLEQEGDTANSGYNALRAYINDEVLDHAAEDKLKDDFKTLQSIFNQLKSEFALRKEKYEKDQKVRDDIAQIISQQEENAKESIQALIDQVIAAYDRNADQYLSALNKEMGFFNLTMRSIRSVFGGEDTKSKLEQLNQQFAQNLNRDMNHIIAQNTDSIKNDIQYMVTQVKNQLDKLEDRSDANNQLFSHLDMKRNEVIFNLRQDLTNFIEKSDVFNGNAKLSEGVDYSGTNLAGGIAAIGATIALIAQHSVLDVTGGIATILALLVAGGLGTFQKSKYMKKSRETILDNRNQLVAKLENDLGAYLEEIKKQINAQFIDFDQALKTERNQIKKFEDVQKHIQTELNQVSHDLDA